MENQKNTYVESYINNLTEARKNNSRIFIGIGFIIIFLIAIAVIVFSTFTSTYEKKAIEYYTFVEEVARSEGEFVSLCSDDIIFYIDPTLGTEYCFMGVKYLNIDDEITTSEYTIVFEDGKFITLKSYDEFIPEDGLAVPELEKIVYGNDTEIHRIDPQRIEEKVK